MPDMENTKAIALTEKQKAILEFIKDFAARNHYSPTYSEIRVGMGFASNNTVAVYLDYLQDAGYITKKARTPRTILVLAHE